VYRYCRARTEAEIIVGEGCGSGRTHDVYAALGYTDFAKREGIRLVDFNEPRPSSFRIRTPCSLRVSISPRSSRLDAFIISIPVLKDHSFTKTTIAMKNMFVCPGPALRRHVEQGQAPLAFTRRQCRGRLSVQEA